MGRPAGLRKEQTAPSRRRMLLPQACCCQNRKETGWAVVLPHHYRTFLFIKGDSILHDFLNQSIPMGNFLFTIMPSPHPFPASVDWRGSGNRSIIPEYSVYKVHNKPVLPFPRGLKLFCNNLQNVGSSQSNSFSGDLFILWTFLFLKCKIIENIEALISKRRLRLLLIFPFTDVPNQFC